LKNKPNSSGLVPWVQNPLKIQEKNQKKIFLTIYPGTKSPFLGAEKIFKFFFWLQLVPSTTSQNVELYHRHDYVRLVTITT
jgi:hypothetical protein